MYVCMHLVVYVCMYLVVEILYVEPRYTSIHAWEQLRDVGISYPNVNGKGV